MMDLTNAPLWVIELDAKMTKMENEMRERHQELTNRIGSIENDEPYPEYPKSQWSDLEKRIGKPKWEWSDEQKDYEKRMVWTANMRELGHTTQEIVDAQWW